MPEYRYELHRIASDGAVTVLTVSHWYDDEEAMRHAARLELGYRLDPSLAVVYVARGGHFCDGE